jgi:nucleotide-binding universal stress UspA family protein
LHNVGIMKPTILVPYDFSPPARAALGWAADLQKSTGAGPLHVIHAVSALTVIPSTLPVGALLPTEEEMKEFEQKMRGAARAFGATAVARVIVRASSIGEIVVEEAQTVDATLIVMGTHGRGAIKRLFLGGVADHVVRHATCPVVTVRDAEADGVTAANRPVV